MKKAKRYDNAKANSLNPGTTPKFTLELDFKEGIFMIMDVDECLICVFPK